MPTNAVPCGSTFKGNAVINLPYILAEIARQNRAEMIAAADKFRRPEQSRVRRKGRPRRSNITVDKIDTPRQVLTAGRPSRTRHNWAECRDTGEVLIRLEA